MKNLTSASILALSLAAVGCQGQPGEMGPMGPIGDRGEQGLEGDQGLVGEQGDQGQNGEEGEQGLQGEAGLQGSAGEDAADVVTLLTSVGAQSDSIVYVECSVPDGSVHGSGTKMVDGRVMTAHHVVRDTEQCFILRGSPITLLGEVTAIAQAGERDQVVLDVQWTVEGEAIVGIEPTRNVEVGLGETLVVVGHPSALLEQQFTVGTVTSTGLEQTFTPPPVEREETDEPSTLVYWNDAWATNAVSAGGSSGGPVFNGEGQWIGLLVGGFTEVDLGIVIPIE